MPKADLWGWYCPSNINKHHLQMINNCIIAAVNGEKSTLS